MTAAGPLLDTRPRIRPDVALGPKLIKGARQVHNLKDRQTGQFFQVGVREFFLISRLDGARTLAEIGEDYAARFRRRLDEQRWQQLLEMLARRRLLVGTDEPVAMAELADLARKQSHGRRSLLKAVLPVVDPDAFLGRVEPWLRLLFSPFAVVPIVAAALLVMSMVLANIAELTRQADRVQTSAGAVALTIAVYWLSMAMHEVGHGVACKHYGGAVHEIGLMWRFPIVAPYCDASDVVVLGNRRHRVYTAFAGVFATMIMLPPIGLLWLAAPPESMARGIAAALLVGIGLGVLANVLPVLQLDGYYMLNHALGLQNLRQESHRYLRAVLGGGLPAVRGYAVRMGWIYGLYGSFSVLSSTALTTFGAWWLFRLLQPRLGTVPAVAIIGLTGAVALAVTLVSARRRRE